MINKNKQTIVQEGQVKREIKHKTNISMDKDIILEEEEPPLLEELGINFKNIANKTIYVIVPKRNLNIDILSDGDLTGPLIFTLILGICLLLRGKFHFGFIFGYGVIGCITISLLLSSMSETGISILRITSVLGYCVLPIIILAILNLFISLKKSYFGFTISLISILWCTISSTRFIENMANMRESRYIIAYPIFLLYWCFTMIVVF